MASSLSDLQRAALDFMIEFKKENPGFITDLTATNIDGKQVFQTGACDLLAAAMVCGCMPADNICIAVAVANDLVGTLAGSEGGPAKLSASPAAGKTISLEDLIRVRQNLR